MPDYDGVRRKYLAELADFTGRSTIIYSADFLNPLKPSQFTQVALEDVAGMMEVFKDLDPPNLDLIIHSPGGQVEAAAKIIEYLRHRFDHIRAIVPHAAMSAGTILACAADEIVMGAHSQLGPIDPQVIMPGGATPSGAIRRQFEDMRDDIAAHPERLGAYVPTLQQYPPGLLDLCERAEQLSHDVVHRSLAQYMFKDDDDAEDKAESIATELGDSDKHLSHGRPLGADYLADLGLHIVRLEDDAELQDRVLSVFHALQHTFTGTMAIKLIENNNGRCWVRTAQFGGGMQPSFSITLPQMPPTA